MLFKPEFGGVATEKTSQIESKILHHDLLARTETALFDAGLAVDINEAARTASDYQALRATLTGRCYVRVEGWAAVEDYERLTGFAGRFKSLARFIGMCQLNNAENRSAYESLLAQLEAARRSLQDEQNRNKRAQVEARLRAVEQQVDHAIQRFISSADVPDWLIEGICMFVDAFLPKHLHVRVCPFENLPAFQVVGGLKRNCLVDGDLESFVFAYGTKPNVRLTLFGLVTSVPPREDVSFDFEREYTDPALAKRDEVAFQKALRGLFNGFEGFERFVRFSRYPNITIQPIAVYRNIRESDG